MATSDVCNARKKVFCPERAAVQNGVHGDTQASGNSESNAEDASIKTLIAELVNGERKGGKKKVEEQKKKEKTKKKKKKKKKKRKRRRNKEVNNNNNDNNNDDDNDDVGSRKQRLHHWFLESFAKTNISNEKTFPSLERCLMDLCRRDPPREKNVPLRDREVPRQP